VAPPTDRARRRQRRARAELEVLLNWLSCGVDGNRERGGAGPILFVLAQKT
jgi:hypothetical protein